MAKKYQRSMKWPGLDDTYYFLPLVSSDDNGKALTVQGGEWVPSEIDTKFEPKLVDDGDVVTFTDVSQRPFKQLCVYGNTAQDGTPTLDAPVPLVSVGDDGAVKVVVAGKNLLDMSVHPQYVDGMIKIPCTPSNDITSGFNLIRVYRGQRYTFSYKRIEPTGDRVVLNFFDRNGEIIGDVDVGWGTYLGFYNGVYGPVGSGATFTIPQDSNVAYVHIRMCKMNTCGEGAYNYYYDMQLEVGSTATDYEPYKSPQTLTLSTPNGLPGIPVDSGGNYTDSNGQQWICDEIDLERGVFVHRTKKFILPIANLAPDESYTVWRDVDGLRDCVPAESNVKLSTCLVNIGVPVCVNTVYTNNTLFVYKKDMGNLTASELKAQYPDLVVEVILPLLTPIETPLSAEDIATFQKLRTNWPVTTIYTSENASLHVECASVFDIYGASVLTTAQGLTAEQQEIVRNNIGIQFGSGLKYENGAVCIDADALLALLPDGEAVSY